jgi:hypothetical protein
MFLPTFAYLMHSQVSKRSATVVFGLPVEQFIRKKRKNECYNGYTCACQSPHVCVPLAKAFAELGDAQGGFWTVPKLLKPLHERPKRHQTKQQDLAIKRNLALRRTWLHHIGLPGGVGWQKGDAVSRVHFHHKVVALSTMTEKGHVSMPLSVPKCLAKEIGMLPFVSYTSSDKFRAVTKEVTFLFLIVHWR